MRVRLLLDDIFTKGLDVGLAAFDAHPNIEVRLFNPFARRSRRALDGLTSFSRINRRMHNKSFTIDNQVSVIGGRNIGGEYFGAGEKFDFGDLDVACIGPVAAEISTMFDAYWNSRPSIPVTALTEAPVRPSEALADGRERLARARDEIEGTEYAAAVRSSILEVMQLDPQAISWEAHELVYDPPEKAQHGTATEAAQIRTPLIRAFDAAQESALIISPYFVPRKSGIERLQDLVDRGIEVTVITNSLAATNQTIVHGGYARSRKPLLRMGVELAEYRAYPDTVDGQARRDDDNKLTLHTKAFVIDGERVFVGSFNFDPRSARINTEMGVIIDSRDIAGDVVAKVRAAMPTRSYAVGLNDNGSIRWLGHDTQGPVVLKREPQAGLWRRFVARFARLLPIRGQL